MGKIDGKKIKEKIASTVSARLGPLKDRMDKNPRLARRMGIITIIILAIVAGSLVYEKEKWDRIIKVSGVIEGDDVRVSFRVQGKIEELLVDEGYLLEEGQIVARLIKDELTQQRDEARAEFIKAQRQLVLDQLDYERAENLFREGAISQQERDNAKTKADTTRASAESLKASSDLAEIKLGWADLASPLNGYVIAKSSLQGEVVQVGEPVFTVVDLNNIWVTAYVNETDLGKVKLNQKAFVKTDSYLSKKYDGWISFISQQAEFTPKYIQTTTERVKYVYRIKVRVDNSSLDLKPGMPADAYIMLE